MRDGKEGCSSSDNGGEKCQIPNLTFPHFSVLFYGNTSTLAFGGFSITVLFLYCGCFWLGNRKGLRLRLICVKVFPKNRYFSEMLFSRKENIFMCLVAF